MFVACSCFGVYGYKKAGLLAFYFFFVLLMTTILSGGTTALEPIITSLGSVMSEFIPYVVYIGLGVLGAVI